MNFQKINFWKKKLKHNITILKNISIYHSLGLPILIGTSRKKFIKKGGGMRPAY